MCMVVYICPRRNSFGETVLGRMSDETMILHTRSLYPQAMQMGRQQLRSRVSCVDCVVEVSVDVLCLQAASYSPLLL